MTSGILSPMHLLIVLVVALLVLGPKRLPGAGKALGQGLREFKDSIGGATDDEPTQIPAAAVAMTPEPVAARTGELA
jgi:sec-independent protein translocase protein TatA